MKKWFKNLFSNTGTIEELADKGREMINESSLTDEDKVDEEKKLLSFFYKIAESIKNASLSRRVLAFVFVMEYMLLINICVIGMFIGASWVETLKGAITDWALWPVNIVVSFYFVTGILKIGNGKK